MSETKRNVPKLRFPGFTEDWEQCKLSEVVNIRRGLTYKPSDISDSGIRVLRSSNIDEDVFVYNEEDVFVNVEAINIPCVKNGDILITAANGSSRLVGKHTIISGLEKNTAVHGGFMLLLETQEPQFIDALLSSSWYKKFINTFVAGGNGAIGNLNKSDLEEQMVYIPAIEEQRKIGAYYQSINNLITLHQRKLENLKLKKKALLQKLFPKNGEQIPELRFPGFTDDWEQRKLWELYERVNERNDGTLGRDKWISVAKMYFQDPDKVQSNNLDTRTYVMQRGDIAFEGHPNNEFKFGRFVLNDIGTGIISELFPIYRAIVEYDLNFWKYAIQLERTMAPIFAKSITSSGNSSNKLDQNHFLQQSITIPTVEEQKVIGSFLENISNLITLHQRKLEHLQLQKKALLQQMFV